MKALAADLFNWSPHAAANMATKSIVRTLANIIRAHDENGNSQYPQAVEMIAFAAASAPLIEPDRLDRLLQEAPKVATAFAPDRYTVRFTSALRTVLEKYPAQRREQLLISAWHQAHEGRWWDLTSGVVTVTTSRAIKHARNNTRGEQEAAAREVLREVLSGAEPGSEEANVAIVDALLTDRLSYQRAAMPLVAALPMSAELEDKFQALAHRLASGKAVDPDNAVYASAVPWLRPAQRPESPIGWLMRTLIDSITTDAENGVVDLDALPSKPRQFNEMFPPEALAEFPFIRDLAGLHNTRLPGAQNVVVELVHNSPELVENRDYMGNCTYSFKSQMAAGTCALFKLWDSGNCYNAMTKFDSRGWTVYQVNTRFNRGNVPDHIRTGFDRLVAAIPARKLDPGEENRTARRSGYAVA